LVTAHQANSQLYLRHTHTPVLSRRPNPVAIRHPTRVGLGQGRSSSRSKAATRRFCQGRCLARLGSGDRREALCAAAHPPKVWLAIGLRPVGHRDEEWLEKGLPSS
jgi:hypothetical protein